MSNPYDQTNYQEPLHKDVALSQENKRHTASTEKSRPMKQSSGKKKSSSIQKTEGLSRRRFLQGSVLAGALAAGGGLLYASKRTSNENKDAASSFDPQPFKADPIGSLRSNADPNRVLILIELAGGNDGLNTVIPYNSATYYDLRPTLAIPGAEALKLDDEVALHPNLVRLHKRGIGVLEGVGAREKIDLSHFEMEARWHRGDETGNNNFRSGFCARLMDPLDAGSPMTGIATGGHTPYFNNARASTIALSKLNYLKFLSKGDPWKDAYHAGLRNFVHESDSSLATVGKSYQTLLNLGDAIGEIPEPDQENPMLTEGGSLGQQLNMTADLLAANVGLRVVHTRLGGFDTHEDQLNAHGARMAQLDAACDGFLQRAEQEGYADQVLLATVSEFGRRVPENGTGTDHGAASCMLLAGAVPKGRLGQAPSLANLDKSENLKATIGFNEYLAGLAEWCGVEPGSILPDNPNPVPLV